MKHIWSVLCQSSIIDQDSKNLSLLNVLESIRFSYAAQGDMVIVPLEATVVTYWVRDDLNTAERGKIRVNIVTPDKRTNKGDPIELDLQEFQRIRFIYRIRGMQFTINGIYDFIVQSLNEKTGKWKTITVIPLELIRVNSPEDLH